MLTGSTRTPLLRRLAERCYHRRRFVLAGWTLVAIGLATVAGATAGEFDNEFGLPGTESQDAFDLLEESGFGDRAGATIQLVVASDAGADGPAVRAGLESVLTEIRAEVDDAEVLSPYEPGGERQISQGGRIAYAEVNLAHRTYDEFRTAGEAIKEAATRLDVDGARLEVGGTADVLAEQEFGSEAFAMLAAAVILLIAFGSLLAMKLPLLTAAFGIACGTAIVQVVANIITMPTFARLGAVHRRVASVRHHRPRGRQAQASLDSGLHRGHQRVLPRVHRVASLLKRWLVGTHQGAVQPELLDYYLDAFIFRFNRSDARARGLLFYRLLHQAVHTSPQPYGAIISAKAPSIPSRGRRLGRHKMQWSVDSNAATGPMRRVDARLFSYPGAGYATEEAIWACLGHHGALGVQIGPTALRVRALTLSGGGLSRSTESVCVARGGRR